VLVQAALITGLLYQRRRTWRAELVARQRLTELARVNRVSTVGELTATIAHELNQPLGAILINAETMGSILKSSSPDLNELREIVADICRDDQRAADVIARLRALLRKAPFELKTIDLNDIVVETLELLSGLTASRQVEIAFSRTSAPLTIKGDPVQLQQILLNLFVNGMDALSDKPVFERQIKIQTAAVDGQAELYLSDNGAGIDADKIKDIFDPFYSTKPNGMGMGLSIVRTIVEAHNGRITAENQLGGGAVFRLRLPLA
jgi:C4-dicarboxylate-specific signal transduction histidine kinase